MSKVVLNPDFFLDKIERNGKTEIDDRFKKLIENDDVTDINWNGEDLWVDMKSLGRKKIGLKLSDSYISKIATKLSDMMKVSFNMYKPLLEAETDELRISILHDSVTDTGTSISIRKTPSTRQLSKKKMYETNYCPVELDEFMESAVKSGCNILVCGLPGVGKTEYVKMLTSYIPASERVITIEDNLEIRYREINPGKDSVALKVSLESNFTYADAIKAALRQFATWIILSEARGIEVENLLQSLSTGCHCMTTVHTDDVRKVPDRLKNMSPNINSNDIYSFLDIAVQIIRNKELNKWCIEQAAFISRWDEQNKLIVFYENGRFVNTELPADIQRKFDMKGLINPLLKLNEDNGSFETDDDKTTDFFDEEKKDKTDHGSKGLDIVEDEFY